MLRKSVNRWKSKSKLLCTIFNNQSVFVILLRICFHRPWSNRESPEISISYFIWFPFHLINDESLNPNPLMTSLHRLSGSPVSTHRGPGSVDWNYKGAWCLFCYAYKIKWQGVSIMRKSWKTNTVYLLAPNTFRNGWRWASVCHTLLLLLSRSMRLFLH